MDGRFRDRRRRLPPMCGVDFIGRKIDHPTRLLYNFLRLGGLSAKAGCYAVVALADNATFLSAVNRMVAFYFAHSLKIARTNIFVISHSYMSGRASVFIFLGRGFESHLRFFFFHISAHSGIFSWNRLSPSVLVERTTPMSPGLKFFRSIITSGQLKDKINVSQIK